MVSELPGGENPEEAGALARKMAAALRQMVEFYPRQLGLSAAEAVAKADEAGWDATDCPADQVSWIGLEELTRTDPEAAAVLREATDAAAAPSDNGLSP